MPKTKKRQTGPRKGGKPKAGPKSKPDYGAWPKLEPTKKGK